MAGAAKSAYRRSGPLVVFGARVRAVRHARGWSQEELAHRASLHSTYVSSVERGERNVSLVNILALGVALDVDPAVFLTTSAALCKRLTPTASESSSK